MKVSIVAKRVVQTIAIVFGFAGLSVLCMSVHLSGVFSHPDLLSIVFMFPGIAYGGVAVFVAYRAITKFSAEIVRAVSAIITIVLYISVSAWVRPIVDEAIHRGDEWRHFEMTLGTLLVFILIYKALSFLLIKITSCDQNSHPPRGNST